MKRVLIAEFFGTFVLALAVLMALETGNNLISIPVTAAVILSLFVYTIGPISGCHINPAVTVALMAVRKIEVRQALGYITVQLAAGTAALVITAVSVGISMDSILAAESSGNFAGELAGTAVLAFGIGSVAYGNTPREVSGLVIGGSLLMGIGVAVMFGAGGILNPAVALATGSLSFSNLFGMFFGGVAGMGLYQFLQDPHKEPVSE